MSRGTATGRDAPDFLGWDDAMLSRSDEAGLSFPFADPPRTGEVVEVAPGVLWTRIPLPFRLDHVNIYVIDDGDGWAILDTGIGDDRTREVWQALLSGPLAGRRITRLIVSHYHPDHIGLAGWLCEKLDIPLLTSQTSYLGCINISLRPGALDAKPYRDFYERHGMTPSTVDLVTSQGHHYLKMVTSLPPTFLRLVGGDRLRLGGRDFEVTSGDGHAPEQLMLYCPADNFFLATDQVIAKISPNISVWAVEPDGDPLGLYLRSLHSIRKNIPADALVLPGHQLPFHGLHERCVELADHHAARCDLIEEACRERPRTVADIVPILFSRELDPHQMSFAFSEAHAHVNYMIRMGALTHFTGKDGCVRVAAA
jgi:glyoxylase-like metal-dependent hydrolase (beta-lactamase superfamily II)